MPVYKFSDLKQSLGRWEQHPACELSAVAIKLKKETPFHSYTMSLAI